MRQAAEEDLKYVGMGGVRLGARTDVLMATLGSCVGIGLIWKRQGRCALAHCLLPDAPGPVLQLGARYVSQAIPSLLSLMGAKHPDYPELEIVLAGGAQMFRVRPNSPNIGLLNVQAAQRHLAALGLVVAHVDIGGRRGRQMALDCRDQSFRITEIARQPEELFDECT